MILWKQEAAKASDSVEVAKAKVDKLRYKLKIETQVNAQPR